MGNQQHGHAAKQRRGLSPEYTAWCNIKVRCYGAADHTVKHYRDRGITMCERWRVNFAAFLEHIGPRPSSRHTIDRINNDGNYEPGNVRWATRAEQARNKRSTRNITFRGETLCLADWARRIGVSPGTLRHRLEVLHLPLDKAISGEMFRGLPGERNGRAKLTVEQVLEIRKLYKTTTDTRLAERFKVSSRMIALVGTKKAWKYA